MRRGFLVTLLLVTLAGRLCAVESGELTMRIVSAEEKQRDRVAVWYHDTPIYQEDPYFAVTVRAGDQVLEAEYEPSSRWETLPAAWKAGESVQGRIRGHSLFLKRPNGAETRFVILKRTSALARKKR